jgi:2-dehydropantoate 2-reductase
MRTMIFGAGAVGLYYGAKLAAAGQPVVFVARDEDDRSALRARGARVKNARGTIAAGDVAVVIDPSQAERCDVVLVTVKSLATQGAAYLLRPVVTADTIVLSLQCGIENDAILDARWVDCRCCAASPTWLLIWSSRASCTTIAAAR